MRKISKRNITFWNSDTPLMSERVGIILGSQTDSGKLADAVRALKSNSEKSFEVSEETKKRLSDATAEK